MSTPIRCPDGGSPSSGFIPLKDGYGIQPLDPSPLGGDMHETLRVNEKGNITEGHTTVRIKGGKVVHLPWK